MTAAHAHAALAAATAGTSVIYHVGVNLKGVPNVGLVRRLYDAGRVELVQRRVDNGFAYIAIFRYQTAKISSFNTFRDAGLA